MWNLQKCHDFCKSWKKTFFPFFFERFDRNLIASSLFQKNKKIRKSVFALLVCCLLMTFSPKNQENHNFFLAVASQNQNISFLIFFIILKCPDFSGAKLKIIFKKYQNSPKFTENMKIPLLLCSKNIWKSSKINENHQAFLSIWKIPY